MKITHTDNPLITSTGFIPDETTGINDEYYRNLRERKQAKRERSLDLLMLLSAMESVMLRDSILPEHLSDGIDKAVAALRAEVLEVGES